MFFTWPKLLFSVHLEKSLVETPLDHNVFVKGGHSYFRHNFLNHNDLLTVFAFIWYSQQLIVLSGIQ